ncbi:MAG: LytTR family DNA-binding domain-containing protein [Myxococcota bacterium]
MPKLEPYGFMRIHRNHAVNLSHIYEIRRRSEGRDWEITLDGPQGQILPIGRSYLSQLWDAYKPSLAID